MAVEYHLLTPFGLGKTCTFTVAGSVVNYTAHGLGNGTGVVFTTTGALPTGLTAGSTYYARSTAANTFTLHPTKADAVAGTNQTTFTTIGSGTHTVTGAYWYNLPTSDPGTGANYKNRYLYSSAFRVSDTIEAWRIGDYASRKSLTTELVLEIQGKRTDTSSNSISLSGYQTITIQTIVNGTRDPDAYHYGVQGTGWQWFSTSSSLIMFSVDQPLVTIDGLDLKDTDASADVRAAIALSLSSPRAVIRNNILQNQRGITVYTYDAQIYNNIAVGCANGGFHVRGGIGSNVDLFFNTAYGCGVGFKQESSTNECRIMYNLSVGNTLNWTAGTVSTGRAYYANNFGLTGEAWDTTTTRGTVATSNLKNPAAFDFSPALSTSPQVEVGGAVLGIPRTDMLAYDRPGYINGTTDKFDAGAIEYNWGNGNIPNFQNIVLTGLVTGSRVKIKKTSDGTSIYNDIVSGTALTVSYNIGATDTGITVDVRKGSAAPFYQPFRTTATVSARSGLSLSISQIPDICAVAYRVGIASDWTINTTTKALAHASGTTVDTVQDLYSWLMDYYSGVTTIDLDPPIAGTTPTLFTLANSGTISDTDHQFLKGGTIVEASYTWRNLYTAGTLSGTPTIYLYQGSSLVTAWWPAGHVDILVKTGGALATSVTVFAREYGKTFSHVLADLTTGGGRTVAPIGTDADSNNATAKATVGAYSGITFTVGATTWDVGDGAGAQAYTATLDCNGYSLAQVYEYTKWWTCRGSVVTLNGVTGDHYQHLASFADIVTAPMGTFAGGKFFLAQGIKLIGIASGDALNFIATDNSGATHTPPAPPVAITAPNLITGTRIQIFNVTTGVELDNSVVTAPYSFTVTVGGGVVSLGDVIRLRACYTSGATAKNDITNTGVITAAGCSFIDTQTDNTIYAAWGIDGSTVTEYSADADHITVDANDADGATTKTRLAAWYTYNCTTAVGIKYYFGGLTALAANNIRVNTALVSLHLKNISALSLRFTDTEIRLYRDDATSFLAAGTGSIEMDYTGVPDVVTVSSGSGLSTAEHNQLMAIPTSGSGSLTPDQDAQLRAALTVGKFLALK